MPGVNLFRRPIDGAFVFVAMLALLTGRLLAGYVHAGLPRVPLRRTVAVAVVAFAVVAWAVAFSRKSNHSWDSFVQVMKAVPIALLVATLLACARSARTRALAAACVAVVGAGELVWWNTASSLNAEAPAYYSVLQQPTGEEAVALAVLEREIESRRALGERPRVEIVGVSGPWQNLAMARGLEATNGYNPLRIGYYDRLVSPGETTHMVDQRLFPASFDGYDCALARELGLEYVVLGRPIDEVPHLARRPVSDVLLAGPKVWIYRLKGAEPRVKVINRVEVADADAQARAGQFRLSPASGTVMVDNDTAPLRTYWPAGGTDESNRARIVSWRADRVEVEVESKEPGILILHEAYYPGWQAEVDGQQARILRTNLLFRGVEVTEGRHLVVFRFAPFSLPNLRDALMGMLRGTR